MAWYWELIRRRQKLLSLGGISICFLELRDSASIVPYIGSHLFDGESMCPKDSVICFASSSVAVFRPTCWQTQAVLSSGEIFLTSMPLLANWYSDAGFWLVTSTAPCSEVGQKGGIMDRSPALSSTGSQASARESYVSEIIHHFF